MIPIKFNTHVDKRGELITTNLLIPFDIKNVFWIYGNQYPRGGHAHKQCEQVLIAVKGIVNIRVGQREFIMSSPRYGLYVPVEHKVKMIFDPGAILLVLASERHDPDDYIQ